MSDRLHIVIDTREQQPWSFRDMAVCSRCKLDSGDYALSGDVGFAVERKTLNDFVGTVTTGWERFRRELQRMTDAQFPARVVIVESDLDDVIAWKYDHPAVKPSVVIKRVAELTLDGVAVLFSGNPVTSAGLCWRLLVEREKRLGTDRSNTDQDTLPEARQWLVDTRD